MLLFLANMPADDRTRLEALYNRYRTRMFSVAYSVLGNRQDAEDAVQTAFVKLAANLSSVREEDSAETGAFLSVIVKNTALDILRKRKKYIDIRELEALPDESGTTVESMAEEIDLKALTACVRRLPSPYYEVLFLHYVRDLTAKRTAALLGRRTATVKQQLVRGKRMLLKLMQEVDYEK